jgi:hypothetical protein
MLLFMDSLTQAHDDGLITDAIFFDFAKAFDKVPHRPLLRKLEAYGIVDEVLKWIDSFLTGRTFRVKVGSTLSQSSPVLTGVPQGSVLGPLLFLVYINDLPDVITSECLLYADDLKIWNASDPSSLQIDIDAIKQWSADWRLPIHADKCVHMSLGGDSANRFVFHGSDGELAIPTSDRKKDLGIWLSSSLSFSHHHRMTAGKAFMVLRMLRRAFPRIEKADFQVLYGVYVRPILEFANCVVYSGLKKDATCLERVQRTATKMVEGLRHFSYADRLHILDLYPLDTRRLRGDLIYTYSLFRSGDEGIYFATSETLHLRGHRRKIFKPRFRTFIRQHFFSCRVVNHWNNLPSSISDASSCDSFKALLDKFLGIKFQNLANSEY